jgi:hypothetical protein
MGCIAAVPNGCCNVAGSSIQDPTIANISCALRTIDSAGFKWEVGFILPKAAAFDGWVVQDITKHVIADLDGQPQARTSIRWWELVGFFKKGNTRSMGFNDKNAPDDTYQGGPAFGDQTNCARQVQLIIARARFYPLTQNVFTIKKSDGSGGSPFDADPNSGVPSGFAPSTRIHPSSWKPPLAGYQDGCGTDHHFFYAYDRDKQKQRLVGYDGQNYLYSDGSGPVGYSDAKTANAPAELTYPAIAIDQYKPDLTAQF